MPKGRIENLTPNEARTPEERRENARKAGKASGKARREKADLRRAVQQALSGTYTDKNGTKVTGEELFIKGLVANLAKPNGRNWAKSIDTLIDLTGAKKSEEERERERAEIDMLRAKIALMQGGDDEAMSKLDEILKGLETTANADTKPETE